MKQYQIVGLMSGSSLDGLDIAVANFEIEEKESFKLNWKLVAADTIPYNEEWIQKLKDATKYDAISFCKLHAQIGHYFGEIVNDFLIQHSLKPDFIASHGHTIFHFPSELFTVQIGDGAAIAAKTGIDVITEFRTKDVALGGQGAPLAPLADKYLLNGYDFYVNLGGIANISCNINGKYIAYDTGAANQVLNVLTQTIGLEYDDKGNMASTGNIDIQLLDSINQNSYYTQLYPKSLDNTWVQQNVTPFYLKSTIELKDKLATATEQTAQQLVNAIQLIIEKEQFLKENYKMIITGGGAFNDFQIERIKALLKKVGLEKIEIIIPDQDIIKFKEALLIALLGLLRIERIPNSMSSVTGASMDNINGAIYSGK